MSTKLFFCWRVKMNITKKVEINRNADDVWHEVARRFDKAHEWMGFVEHSYKVEEGDVIEGAPMVGRVCEFTKDPNGLKAEERILNFSEQDKRFDFDVIPKNAPVVFPVKKNVVTMTVSALSSVRSEVVWHSNIELSTIGYLVYPILKRGLSKNFAGVMADLKIHMESNQNSLAA